MIKVDVLYFSPTGGTKKVSELLAKSMSTEINYYNLMDKQEQEISMEGDIAIISAPVFGGRIPAIMADKVKKIIGRGKKAVTLVVYGTRAFEDALIELNDAVMTAGFEIVASGAFVAQHSIVNVVGMNRPDEKDSAELKAFGDKIVKKLKKEQEFVVQVPGNYPYKADFSMSVTPVSLECCNLCGKCSTLCPVNAITMGEDTVVTDVEKCILCMACVKECHSNARILPPPLQEQMNQKLAPLKDVRRENQIFV